MVSFDTNVLVHAASILDLKVMRAWDLIARVMRAASSCCFVTLLIQPLVTQDNIIA
jgi:hypothetical protein